ncbi:hypothetical protein O0I10_012181 [Lichtheimia ornata]|uniref:Uncharacterized protein n=1 Tax=Lichtheimia ornata TaxID=688661 RepID=A0AAD7UTF8_9FUNG|nr:uncharacterized protein O0I10_012181 [Lichtheimia ornata]KAJ8652170.1 hypothetical protein O0I10_012181 [Lichtheimia ornata]
MADIIPQVPVRIPLGISSIVGSYDSYATVWSALSWPYQLRLMITALAVGSQTVTRPNMLARAAPVLEDAIENAMASLVIRRGAP